MFNLGNLYCNQNEKIKGFWEIENYSIPVTIICGEKTGKVVTVCSGIHSCEYAGIQSAIELSQDIEAKDIKGTLIILHPVNYSGFFKRVVAILPEDGKNINRAFPGTIQGSLSEKIAYHFSKYLYPQLDFFLDIHGGDVFEDVMPFIYAPGIGSEEIINISHNIANEINMAYRVRSKASTGAYNSAAIQGVPALLLERGGKGCWTTDQVSEYKKDISKALVAIGVLNSSSLSKETLEKTINQIEIKEVRYIDSHLKGYWYPALNPEEKFKEGDLIGEIKDCFGETLHTFYAEFDGVVLYQTVSLSININDSLIAYGKL